MTTEIAKNKTNKLKLDGQKKLKLNHLRKKSLAENQQGTFLVILFMWPE